MTYESIFTLANTFVITLFTAWNVILAMKLLKESKLSRYNNIQAHMIAYLTVSETDPTLLFLNIENVGQGLAENVFCKVVKDINHSESYRNYSMKKLKELGIFEKPIRYIPSKHKNKYFLFGLSIDYDAMIQEYIILEIFYNNGLENVSEEIKLDFNNIAGLSMLTPPDNYIGLISYRLEKIEKLLDKKIRMDITPKEDSNVPG